MRGGDSHQGARLRLRPTKHENDRSYEIRKEDFRISSSYGNGITCMVPEWYYRQIALMLSAGDDAFARKAVERDSGFPISSLHLYRIAQHGARKL